MIIYVIYEYWFVKLMIKDFVKVVKKNKNNRIRINILVKNI